MPAALPTRTELKRQLSHAHAAAVLAEDVAGAAFTTALEAHDKIDPLLEQLFALQPDVDL